MNPAQWKYDVKPTSENEAELVFTVTLDENWHIYSQHTDEMGPIGLSFSFDKSSDYTLVGGVNEPKPHEEYDEMFKCTIRSFSGTVVFKQKIKIRILGIDFIDTDGFRERNMTNMTIFIKNPNNSGL